MGQPQYLQDYFGNLSYVDPSATPMHVGMHGCVAPQATMLSQGNQQNIATQMMVPGDLMPNVVVSIHLHPSLSFQKRRVSSREDLLNSEQSTCRVRPLVRCPRWAVLSERTQNRCCQLSLRLYALSFPVNDLAGSDNLLKISLHLVNTASLAKRIRIQRCGDIFVEHSLHTSASSHYIP